ncbi:class I SAM-dependent methyltransferase [Cyanobium sp. FGCU-52]|nr:class I SAM-dependent methyltransferase [Cyanobium sp. FGCU52]
MAFSLDRVVPWGRSYDEYVRMFDLGPDELGGRILGCGDGPAAFQAEHHRRGGRGVAIDPLYAFSAAEIEQRIAATHRQVMAQVRANRADFVWITIPSPEELERQRLAAMAPFLADYETGRQQGRYVAGEAQALPFAADHFDLALSSHFLLLYAEAVPLAEQRQAIAELLRVAPEVRIFPLLELGGAPSRHLEPLMEELRAQGCGLELRRVAYELQRGGHTLLRIVRPVLTNEAIEALAADVLALRLPRERWTHQAHLAVGLWHLRRHGESQALELLRTRIRAHNVSAGIVNDVDHGYHETLTCFWLRLLAVHEAAHPQATLAGSLALLLRSPLASADAPLRHYKPERLFSRQARAGWLEPDRAPLPR